MKSSTAVILILISIGLYYTFISPQYLQVKALRAEENQYSDILANVSDLNQKRDALYAKSKAIDPAEIDRLDKVLPDHIDTVMIARDFDTIASRYGIAIKSLNTTTSAQDSNNVDTAAAGTASPNSAIGAVPQYQKVNIALTFVATYPNFRRFLRDLESSIRIQDITDLYFTATDNGLNEYHLTLRTYWLKS